MTVPRLVCLGSFTIDDVVLPDGTERPACIGGDAVYAALGARLWETRTEMVAPIGDDLPPGVLQSIAGAGFRTDHLESRPFPTLHNRVVYDSYGGRCWTLFSSEEVFHELSPKPQDIPEQFLEADAFLILAMTLAAQEELLAFLRERTSAVLILDLQEDYISGNEDRILALLPMIDIFMPSADEVQQLVGTDDWMEAARLFATLGPSLVVIKLGDKGCLIYDAKRDEAFSLPAFTKKNVQDTTGAGDSFCGGFVAALDKSGNNLVEAARAASVSAFFAISSYGADDLFTASATEARRHLSNWHPGTRWIRAGPN